jgi:hypothetical protein
MAEDFMCEKFVATAELFFSLDSSEEQRFFFSEPGLDRQIVLLSRSRAAERLFFQSQDWIGRNSCCRPGRAVIL